MFVLAQHVLVFLGSQPNRKASMCNHVCVRVSHWCVCVFPLAGFCLGFPIQMYVL